MSGRCRGRLVVMIVVLDLQHEVLVGLQVGRKAVDAVQGGIGGIVTVGIVLGIALDPTPDGNTQRGIPGIGMVSTVLRKTRSLPALCRSIPVTGLASLGTGIFGTGTPAGLLVLVFHTEGITLAVEVLLDIGTVPLAVPSEGTQGEVPDG